MSKNWMVHVLLPLLALFALSARAQTPVTLQRINIIVGTPAGGGYDSYARLVSRHLGNFLPGSPSIVVQNMPGAGSLTAANWMAASAPRDGSTIGVLPNTVLFEPLLGNASARFRPTDFALLGSLNNYNALTIVRGDSPIRTASDLFDHDVLTGASAATSVNSLLPRMLNNLIGTHFNVVHGYPGSAGLALAMERGEIQAMVGDIWEFIRSSRPDWLRKGEIRVIMQVTTQRAPDLKDVPTVLDIAPAEKRQLLEFLLGRQTYAGVFLTPPGVPDTQAQTLRKAFDAMVASPDFVADARKSSVTLNPAPASTIEAAMRRILDAPPALIDEAKVEMRRLDP